MSAYICSDTSACYAKRYADANGIEFRVCQGHNPTIAIQNYADVKTVDYRTTITFSADEIMYPVAGASIHWFIDGQDMGESDTYTEKEAKKLFTVSGKVHEGRRSSCRI